MVARPTSALGEAVGKLFEKAVLESVRDTVELRNHSIRPARLRNGTGNVYQIDAVVFNADEQPVIIIDPKYIRYTKHNRDKGSWLCVAHYNLRKSHPTIRKSIAVLAGRWSNPSKELVRSFGVELLEVPFNTMAEAVRNHGIEMDWPEQAGDEIAAESLTKLQDLAVDAQLVIGFEMVASVREQLNQQIAAVLDTDIESIGSRVNEVEVLLKTDQGEMVLSSFPQVTDAMKALTELVSDKPDIRSFLG